MRILNSAKVLRTFLGGMLVCAASLPLPAQSVFSSGSTGADGAYSPTVSETFTITKPEYNFTSIDIPEGVTVTFEVDQALNYPVVWLASDAVDISGTVDLSGEPGHAGLAPVLLPGIPGPGGWQGGVGAAVSSADPDTTLHATAGLGPGGGLEATGNGFNGSGAGARSNGALGTFQPAISAGKSYGNSFCVPLLGGSGGGGGGFNNNPSRPGSGGGSGGGAILIASSDSISVTGSILANGGAGGDNSVDPDSFAGGGGSGGMIRLVSNSISVSGTLSAAGGLGGNVGVTQSASFHGGTGSDGRLRLDAYSFNLEGSFTPLASTGVPILLDPPGDSPRLQIASVDGTPITNPTGSTTNVDITIGNSTPVDIVVTAANIPVGTNVEITLAALNGPGKRIANASLTGTVASSSATATLAFEPGVTQINARASFAPLAKMVATATGEEIERVEITIDNDGKRELAYLSPLGTRFSRMEVREK